MEIRATKIYTPTGSNASVTAVRANATGLAGVPVVTGSPPGTRFFNGDYSTNNFLQWPYIATVLWNDPAAGYNKTTTGYPNGYPAAIVTDPVKTRAARFELRAGDLVGSTSSSQVTCSSAQTGTGAEGQIRWYQFSMKFDATFPQNHASLGWGLVNQWHDGGNESYSPSVAWYVDRLDGNVSLTISRQPSPGVYDAQFSIYNIPLGTAWHDVKMRVLWSRSDTVGSIQLWYNGVRQNFLQGPYGTIVGGNTYMHRTLHPTSSSVYYKEGYYRDPNVSPTGILWHAGFRAADQESAL